MGSSVAPLPSSSSNSSTSKYLITENRGTAPTTTLSAYLKPPKEAWKNEVSSSPKTVVTARKLPLMTGSKLEMLTPDLLDEIIQYAPNLALPLVHRKFKDIPTSISRLIHQVFIEPRKLPLSGITGNLDHRIQASIPGRVNESVVIAIDSETKNPENSAQALSLRNYESLDAPKKPVVLTPAEYKAIWKNLPMYFQMMEQEYRRRAPLVRYSDYILQALPPGILLWFKELPPFSIHWTEETFTMKQKEFDLYLQGKIPPGFSTEGGRVLREMSYFLAETSFPKEASSPPEALPIASSPAETTLAAAPVSTETIAPPTAPSAVSFVATARLILREETLEERKALQLEVDHRIAKDSKFLSRLFRYILDQIFNSTNDDSIYRTKLYSVATSYVTHCNKHLSYEDLHYALLIHIYMVLTRADIEGKSKILKPELIHLIFDTMKMKKAVSDEVKGPKLTKEISSQTDLTELRQQLQIFLSDYRYNALLVKMNEKKGKKLISLRLFISGEYEERHDSVIEIVKRHLPSYVQQEFKPFKSSANGRRCIIA